MGAVPDLPPVRPLTELEARRLGPVRRWFAERPVAADITAMAVVVVVNLAVLLAVGVPDRRGARVDTYVALTVAVVVALWFRRRRPVLVLAVVCAAVVASLFPLGGVGVGAVAWAVACYTVAATRPPGLAWAVLGAALAAVGLALAVAPHRWAAGSGMSADPVLGPLTGTDLAVGSFYLVTGIGALAVGVGVYGRRQHVATLVRRSQELVRAGEQQARLASIQERTRIAREMHDVVAHSLSVMITLADGARAAATRSPQAAAEALDLLTETGRAAITDMRRMLGVLRDGQVTLAPQPTGADELAGLVASFRSAGLDVQLRADPLPPHDGLRVAVFRLVQESLTNALRHSAAARVDVTVAVSATQVEVEVRDDGDPVERPAGPAGRGLIGMRERVAMFDGALQAGPAPGGGWQVRAVLAVPVAQAGEWVLPG